eukprot:GFUD01033755.1.p1 GENE.GFUD01033755.1~~GFUD01033755.1.p1  ORF type:complete len:808 (+),score=275.25 GFUD01033755.1:59-2482(+)
MSSQLSDLDFQRLQESLLELKTRNYTLEDQARKQRSALGDATARVTVLQQELTKATKAIDKSKKITEVQKILNENDNLQRKLMSQEDDFRLQNQTLLTELTVVVTANEKLEKELGKTNSETNTINVDQSNLIDEIAGLKQKLKLSEEEEEKSSRKISDLEEELSQIRKHELDQITDEFSMGESNISDKHLKDLEKKVSEIEDLKIEIEGEKSEKKLAKQHNEELKSQANKIQSENQLLKEEIGNLEEKLKKKQTTLKEVQSEKEKLIETYDLKIEENEKKCSEQIRKTTDLNQRLQTQINNSQGTLSEVKENFARQTDSLNEKIKILEVTCQKYSEEDFKELDAKNMCLKNELERMEIEKERISINFEKLKIDFEKLSIDFTINKSIAEEAQNCNSNLSEELDALKKVSEKRKLLIDEMAIEIQQKIDEQQQSIAQYNLSINQMSEQKSQEILHLELQIQGLQDKINDLVVWPQKYEELSEKTDSLKEDKKALETELDEMKKQNFDEVNNYEKNVKDLKTSFSLEKDKLNNNFENKIRDFEMQLELVSVQKCEFEENVSKLKQDIKDGLEDRKISEKKGHSLIKDLKRQLQNEKNRNEKLQEKMKECFETTSNLSEPSRDLEGDRTSISSWSVMSGQNDRDTSTPNPLSSSPFPSSNGLHSPEESAQHLNQENEALLARLAKLQEEKWNLEERLTMLEQSGAGMADEIVAKTKLIQQYCMDSGSRRGSALPNRSLPSTPSGDKMRNFVDKLDKFVHLDSQKETHTQEVSNMQKMLEETLTKNMHLQQDLDNMSQELVRLSKLAVSSN